MDKHLLYELCVQSVAHVAPLFRAIHGQNPKILGEDFAGTAALSRHWIATDETANAVAVDTDADTLARAGQHDRLTTIVSDVMTCDAPVDIIFVGNFSIGYLHTRDDLVRYLAHARSRLGDSKSPERERRGTPAPSPLRGEGGPRSGTGEGSGSHIAARTRPWHPGVFICDTYGGESTFLPGQVHRYHPIPDHLLEPLGVEPGTRVRYTWEQREADPLTGMVTNAIHFRLERSGVILAELDDAFIYHWRLWSVPELRDALIEAGFAETAVYNQEPDAVDDDGNAYCNPIEDPEELDDSFIVFVAGLV